MIVENLARRPDLLEQALRLGDVGAEFMNHDPVGALTRATRLAVRWPEYYVEPNVWFEHPLQPR